MVCAGLSWSFDRPRGEGYNPWVHGNRRDVLKRRFRFGFVGAGNMATALCRGIVESGLAAPEEVVASDPDAERRRLFESQTGARTTGRNDEACEAEVVVLAVKPQDMRKALEGRSRS